MLVEAIPTVLVMVGAPSTWLQRAIVPTLTRAGAVASHGTAARLHGIGDQETADTPIEVLVERNRSVAAPGVIVHSTTRWSPRDLTTVHGIRCTSIARTLCDLGASVDDDFVERSVDESLRRGASPRWIESRLRELHRPGPSGTGGLDRVLSRPDRGVRLPDSWFERMLARSIVAAGLPPMHLQFPVSDGSSRFRLDGAYPGIQLGVEADGDQFHSGAAARRRDRARENRLRALGWEIVHAGWEDRYGDTAFIDALRAAHERRSRLLGSA